MVERCACLACLISNKETRQAPEDKVRFGATLPSLGQGIGYLPHACIWVILQCQCQSQSNCSMQLIYSILRTCPVPLVTAGVAQYGTSPVCAAGMCSGSLTVSGSQTIYPEQEGFAVKR